MYENKGNESPTPKPGMVITVGSKVTLLLITFVGLLLLVVGASTNHENVSRAGGFIFPFGLI